MARLLTGSLADAQQKLLRTLYHEDFPSLPTSRVPEYGVGERSASCRKNPLFFPCLDG